MHPQCYAYVARWARRLGSRAFVLEVGGRDVNGSVRPLFPDTAYLAIDVTLGPGVDVVADGATYQPEAAPDTIVATEVLEHTPHGQAIIANAHRVLAPGGVLILTAAWLGRPPHSGIDGGPLRPGEWYQSVNQFDLVRWLRPFDQFSMETDAAARDIRCVAFKLGETTA